MAFDDPLAITGLNISALEGRRAQAALLAHADSPVSALPGVLYGFGCTIASLTLTVAAGSAVLSPSAGANGSYLAVNNADMTWPVTAQDATYARIDRVALRIYDNEVDAGGQNKAAVEVIAGTPAASPVAPTLPSGRLEIAQLQVPKSGAGSITVVDKRMYAAAVGGVIVAQSYATLPSGSWLRYGQKAFTIDYLVTWRWNGTAWIVDGNPVFASTANRDSAIPSPTVGTRVFVGARTTTPTVTDTLWEYLYDGTAWVVQTSPWQAITAAAGYTTDGQVRFMGGVVLAKGTASGNTTVSTNTQIATIPAGFIPPYLVAGITDNGANGQTAGPIWIDNTGKVWVRSASATGAQIFSFRPLSGYSVSSG